MTNETAPAAGNEGVQENPNHSTYWFNIERIAQLEQENASLTATVAELKDRLASIRVFSQDCIENGHDRGSLGNLYSIRDLCDKEIPPRGEGNG